MSARSLGMLAVLLVTGALADTPPASWTTYRSDTFGYRLSYPPALTLHVYFDGVSADLRDERTGATVAALEVWPPDECPKERGRVTPRALAIERATAVTQADGADGSSSCGEPVTVRERTSAHGAPLFELELTCSSERMDEAGTTIHRAEGHKGPTFVADISPAWRTRVLTIDPVGVDPRLPARTRADPALVRRIAETVATYSIEDPHVTCIEDLPPGVATNPARAAPPP
jgi:hypothetical protein